jgi:BASS family bile acid:Na+ symporter
MPCTGWPREIPWRSWRRGFYCRRSWASPRAALGESRVATFERRLKVVAPVNLLVLCYANASSCLPEVLGDPDWDFLGVVMVYVTGLCTVTFTAGYVLARVFRADRGQRVALIYGLGMNNNGTGLVLASLTLGSKPMVILPIIVYNLTQHVVAGCVNAMLRVPEPEGQLVGRMEGSKTQRAEPFRVAN